MSKITNRVIESPDDADLRCEAASILIDQGLDREAVGWLVSTLKCDPAHRKAHHLLGEYCRKTGNRKLAAQLHLFKGTGLLREGRLLDALEEFGHAKDHPDTAASAYALSGEALYKAGEFGNAVHILNRALQLDPTQIDARRWLAATYHDTGAMNHALQQLHIVAQEAPTDPRPHRLMGLMHKDFEAYEKAIAAYRESLRRDPGQPDKDKIRIELAECQIKLRKHAEALETLGECPKSVQKYALEAECHYGQRDASSARRLVSQVLELQPDHLEAMKLAATLDLEAGDVESSVRILRQAVEYHPKEFRVRYRLAQAYQQLGEPELANEQMSQMQELRKLRRRFTDLHGEAIEDPDNVDIRYQLAVLADQLGKPELARTWYAAVIGMDPNHEDARKALAAKHKQTPPAAQGDSGPSPTDEPPEKESQ
jgi:tetratricopeptide (TPR) repeat protein